MRAIQTSALSNVADGMLVPDVVVLAKLGTAGRHPQNVERDLERQMRKAFNITLDAYEIEVPYKKPGMSTIVGIVLPHELWSKMWNEHPDEAKRRFMGAPGAVRNFWEHAKSNEEDWYLFLF